MQWLSKNISQNQVYLVFRAIFWKIDRELLSFDLVSLGIVLGEDSANTRVVARMSDCYISVAVDPSPNAEEATICMLGKTEDAVENAKDALEALALGAQSHPL